MKDPRDIVIPGKGFNIRIPYGNKDNPVNNVVQMKNYQWADHWQETYSHDGENGTLQAHVNSKTGELEIVQMNDDGECYRSCLSAQEAKDLLQSLEAALRKPTVP